MNYDFLPEPRERDLGNGIVALENAYSIFLYGNLIGVEYVQADEWCTPTDPTPQPFNTGHMMFVCPDCGEVWARKVLRAFPLWEAKGWIVEVIPCDGAILAYIEEAAFRQSAVLLQAMDAFLCIWGNKKSTCETKR